MGRKNNLKQFQSIINESMVSNIISPITDLQFLDNIGIQLDFSGAPVGNFQVQVSADYSQDLNGNVQEVGSWVPLILTYFNGVSFTSSPNVPTSVGSPIYLDLNQLSAPFIRVAYYATSGSGTLNAYITAKMI